MSTLLDQPLLLALLIGVLLLLAYEAGFRLSHTRSDPDEERFRQWKVVRDTLSVLLSLLLGFTLAMSLSRFEHRRDLVVQEANAIGTAFLRSKLLPAENSVRIRSLLLQYIDARESFFTAGLNAERIRQAEGSSSRLQQQLWDECLQSTRSDRTAVAASFVQALNQMFDLDEERLAALDYRIPTAVWLLIAVVAVFAMAAQGATARRRYLLPMLTLPIAVAVVCALTADLDTSRSGLIRVDQQSMQRVKANLSAN